MTIQYEKMQISAAHRIIGLTGGIGMGKTTVTNYLTSAHKLPVLDADQYAREAVVPNSEILSEIIERYGLGILLSDGTLDRRRLGNIIFSSASERLWLEQRIHPYVRDRFEADLLSDQLNQQNLTIVLAVPLLFEARMADLATEIWVVHCNRKKQIQRLLHRDAQQALEGDRLTLAEIQTRINSQMDIERKIVSATVAIDNSSTLEALYAQVDAALNQPQTIQGAINGYNAKSAG